MKSLTATILFLHLSTSVIKLHGQDVFPCSSRSCALADATVTLSDCWSVFGNQAGLSEITKPEIGLSFRNSFGLKELAIKSGMIILPIRSTVYALSFVQYGKNLFKQEYYGFSYAKSITPDLKFGLQFHYFRQYFPEDNYYSGIWGLDLGIQVPLNKSFSLGLHIHNPYKTSIKTLNSKIQYPSDIKLGATLLFSESFIVYTELENNFNQQITARTAFEYTILEKFIIRSGIVGKPYRFAAGFGFQINKTSIDLANSYHPYLGNTPSISFKYKIK